MSQKYIQLKYIYTKKKFSSFKLIYWSIVCVVILPFIPVGYNNIYVHVGKPCIILSEHSVVILVKQLDQSNKF